MPRVSDEHLAARRRQILDAARICFLRNGFHASTMQDVIREAGLSVGAVYRYFPGKDAIIAAIAEQALGSATDLLSDLSRREPAPDLAEAMTALIDAMEPQLQPDGASRIAIQVWAEALRDEALAALAATVFGTMRGHLEVIAARARDAGHLPADADPAGIGAALFALMPGYAVQRALTGSPDRDTYVSAVRALLS